MATHSRILAWKIPWMEKPGGLQSMGSERVGHNLVSKQERRVCVHIYTCVCTHMYMHVCMCYIYICIYTYMSVSLDK